MKLSLCGHKRLSDYNGQVKLEDEAFDLEAIMTEIEGLNSVIASISCQLWNANGLLSVPVPDLDPRQSPHNLLYCRD